MRSEVLDFLNKKMRQKNSVGYSVIQPKSSATCKWKPLQTNAGFVRLYINKYTLNITESCIELSLLKLGFV